MSIQFVATTKKKRAQSKTKKKSPQNGYERRKSVKIKWKIIPNRKMTKFENERIIMNNKKKKKYLTL